jgi:hypothetical protein
VQLARIEEDVRDFSITASRFLSSIATGSSAAADFRPY